MYRHFCSALLLQASGSWDKTICVWNASSKSLLHVLRGHEGWVQAVAFSSDSRYLVSASDEDSVKVWDVDKGECIRTLEVLLMILSYK